MSRSPLLTIGMPVYNGERFLAKALDSFLSQTFTDFTLILSDNASTDRTQAICREYAARDGRIRYFRNKENIGAGRNQQRVYALATGKYFKLAAHDDFCDPLFLETCISALERDAGLAAAYTKVRIVDINGALIEDYECPMRVAHDDPVIRFADLILVSHRCFPVFGVHRLDLLRQLPPMGCYPHADGVLLAQLALLGRFHESAERLFTSTRHPGQSVFTLSSRTRRTGFRLTRRSGRLPSLEWWDPARSHSVTLPECRILREYWDSVQRARLSPSQKAHAFLFIGKWALKYRRKLLSDFLLAADQLLWKWQSRHASEDVHQGASNIRCEGQ